MASPEPAPERRVCGSCRAELAPGLLVCPSCQALVHAEALKRLAETADRASQQGDPRTALSSWREALELLPPESMQSRRLGERVAVLSLEVDKLPIIPAVPAAPASGGGGRGAWWAALGGVGLLLWKLKFIVAFILTKLKLLLFGLSKGTTVLSMLASAALYWTIWGWPFALGLVASIYVHEMGHVAALQRLGIRASAPMFIPGLGAFVRLKQYPANRREDAYVGLAGPIWGMAAAIVCFGLWLWTGYGLWGALTEWGGRINLFNLMPLGPLDGGRGFRALSRSARWGLVGLAAAGAWLTGEPVLWFIVIVGGVRAFGGRNAAPVTDRRALVQFAVLIVVLSFLTAVPIRMGLVPR